MKAFIPTALAVLCALVAGLAWWSSTSLSLIGPLIYAAALGISLDFVWQRHKREFKAAMPGEIREKFEHAVFWAGVLGLASWAMWPLPFEQPLSQDHANHYLNLEIFWELLGSGHLFGWTDRIATGHPFGDTYGTLVYLLPTVPKILSFGWLSTATCYALTIWGVWVLGAAIVGGITRRITGGWLAPWLASAAFVLDVGADREGGWLYSMFHAVWPQWLASVVFLGAVWRLLRLWQEPTWQRLGLASAVVGVGIWMHPMNALNFALFAPVLAVVLGLYGRDESRTSGSGLLWVVAAHVLGALIGLGWMAHMLVARASVGEWVASGTQLLTLGDRWWQGTLFGHSVPIWGALALFGVVVALRRRQPEVALILAGATTFTLLQSMDLLAGLELAHWDTLPDLMWRRFVLTAKPFWFVLTGVGAGAVIAGLRNTPQARPNWPIGWLAAAPVSVALLLNLHTLAPGPAARPLHAGQADLGKTVRALKLVLQPELETQSGRVAFWRDRGDDGEYPLVAFADLGLSYVATQVPPTQAFTYANAGRDLATLRKLGVRWVVSQGPADNEGLKKLGTAGPYVVYRVTGDVAPHPVELKGPGKLEVVSWEPMRRVLKLEGVTEKSTLHVLHGPYLKWQVTGSDGAARTLQLDRRSGWNFSKITDLKDGQITLVFEDTAKEKIAFVFGCLALLGSLGLLLRRRPLPEVPFGIVLERTLGGAALGGIALGLATLHHVGERATDDFWKKDEPENLHVLGVLHRHAPAAISHSPSPYCVRPYSRNPRPGCVESTLAPRLEWDEQTQTSCMALGVPDRGETRLRVELPGGTQFVKGRLGAERSVTVELVTHGKRVKVAPGNFRHPAQLQAELVIKNTGSTAQVCIEWVALGEP